MTNEERAKHRARFVKLCLESGYPEGVYPGASFRTPQPMLGNMQALPTCEGEYRESRLYRILPEGNE
jgi:hypothetical protein